MERKEFLKLSCNACLLAGAGLLSAQLLAACGPAKQATADSSKKEGSTPAQSTANATGKSSNGRYKTSVVNKEIQVPLTALAATGVTIIRAKGMDFDIALHQTAENAYEALLLCCTHFSNPLVRQGDGYHCNTHGSEFDANGKVTPRPRRQPSSEVSRNHRNRQSHHPRINLTIGFT